MKGEIIEETHKMEGYSVNDEDIGNGRLMRERHAGIVAKASDGQRYPMPLS